MAPTKAEKALEGPGESTATIAGTPSGGGPVVGPGWAGRVRSGPGTAPRPPTSLLRLHCALIV